MAPSFCKIFKKFFGPIQSYEDVPFSGPKWPISHEQNFFGKNHYYYFHLLLALFLVQWKKASCFEPNRKVNGNLDNNMIRIPNGGKGIVEQILASQERNEFKRAGLWESVWDPSKKINYLSKVVWEIISLPGLSVPPE